MTKKEAVKNNQIKILSASDKELLALSKKAVLSLSLVEMKAVKAYFKKLGWRFVALDIDGYRTGSLNPPKGKLNIKN